MKIIDAKFVAGFATPESLPRFEGGEVGVIGRSNVGKSSLLNRLMERKSLARVSNTPGRTLQMNIFEITYEKPPSSRRTKFNLVDLPGFGFAKADKQTCAKIFDLVTSYIGQTHQKKVLLLLVDPRRDPGEEELDCVATAKDLGTPLIIVMTKMDKLNTSEKFQRKKAVAAAFNVDEKTVVESGEGIPVHNLWKQVLGVIS
jgi:GTP-binding protein